MASQAVTRAGPIDEKLRPNTRRRASPGTLCSSSGHLDEPRATLDYLFNCFEAMSSKCLNGTLPSAASRRYPVASPTCRHSKPKIRPCYRFNAKVVPSWVYIHYLAGYRQSSSQETADRVSIITLLSVANLIGSHNTKVILQAAIKFKKKSNHGSTVTSRTNYSRTFYSSPSRSSYAKGGSRSAKARRSNGPRSPGPNSGQSCRPCLSSHCVKKPVESVVHLARLLGCSGRTPKRWVTMAGGERARGENGYRV
jgi:hypothetical protein